MNCLLFYLCFLHRRDTTADDRLAADAKLKELTTKFVSESELEGLTINHKA